MQAATNTLSSSSSEKLSFDKEKIQNELVQIYDVDNLPKIEEEGDDMLALTTSKTCHAAARSNKIAAITTNTVGFLNEKKKQYGKTRRQSHVAARTTNKDPATNMAGVLDEKKAYSKIRRQRHVASRCDKISTSNEAGILNEKEDYSKIRRQRHADTRCNKLATTNGEGILNEKEVHSKVRRQRHAASHCNKISTTNEAGILNEKEDYSKVRRQRHADARGNKTAARKTPTNLLSHTIITASNNKNNEVCNSHVEDTNNSIHNRDDREDDGYNILPGAVAVGSNNEIKYRSKMPLRHSEVSFTDEEKVSNIFITKESDYDVLGNLSGHSSDNHCSIESIANEQRSMSRERRLTKVAILIDDQAEERALERKVEEIILTTRTVTAEEVDVRGGLKRRFVCIGLIVIIFIFACVVLVVLLSRGNPNKRSSVSTPSPTNTAKLTMETVMERGVLNCGVPKEFLGLAMLNKTSGKHEGFEIDSCRAVAAAVLGDDYKINIVQLTWTERFLALSNMSVDLLAQSSTHTMERDVYQSDAEVGFTFSVPYLYDGLGFGGKPSFVECADNIEAYGTNCSGLKICVTEHSTHYEILQDLFPDKSLVTLPSGMDPREKFISGECNVIAHESVAISEVFVRSKGYTGDYSVGKSLLSKDPRCIVTRDDDHEWSSIINWILQAQFVAEAMNITQENASNFSKISPYGDKYNHMFIKSITAVGNYGERYERHLEKLFPRKRLNMLYLNDEQQVLNSDYQNNGLLYWHPFGPINNDGPEPTISSHLHTISQRGVLRCGIKEVRDGFARFVVDDNNSEEWEGLDIDYCNVVAAAIFGSVLIDSTVEYVNLTNKNNSSLFKSIVDYDVDLVCGVETDINANIEMGISFSQPYFYEGKFSSRSLATYGKEDTQFADFVWWVVSSTFYAEEQNITSTRSNDMPEVRIFGSRYSRMFRDAILFSGNYGNMYEHNLQSIIPRSGRNNLNSNPMIGPQINPYVGF